MAADGVPEASSHRAVMRPAAPATDMSHQEHGTCSPRPFSSKSKRVLGCWTRTQRNLFPPSNNGVGGMVRGPPTPLIHTRPPHFGPDAIGHARGEGPNGGCTDRYCRGRDGPIARDAVSTNSRTYPCLLYTSPSPRD